MATLSLMMIFPNWLSMLAILAYTLVGNPRFLEMVLSLLFNHEFNALHSQDRRWRSSRTLISFVTWFCFDSLLVALILMFNPGWLDYPKLLAKASVAARLISTSKRQTLDTILSSVILVAIGKFMEHVVISSGESVWPDVFGLQYLDTPRDPLRLLMYRLSSSGASRIVFGFDYVLEFFYSTLAVHTVLYRANQLIYRLWTRDNISKSLESVNTMPMSKRPALARQRAKHANTRISSAPERKMKKAEMENITVPEDVSKSQLPFLREAKQEPEEEEEEERADSQSSTTTPAAFPLDQQEVIMNDISSPTLVMAQNFENYLRMSFFPFIPAPETARAKSNPYLDKKMKESMGHKGQQLLWTLLNAFRTMLGQQDLYSGDYFQHNAVVATDPTVEGYGRSFNSSSQCFVWYTGETAIAFELRDITLDQLLVRVNGIIWEHVSSASLYGRELVIVKGLSPLCQYDIDFIKILDNGELSNFATTTVSTIHQNSTLTESKPSTPLATLQESVVTTQNAIDREKAKLKKLKADWKKRGQALKAEIENSNNRGSIGDESRYYKKVESLRQTVARYDRQEVELSKRFEEMYAIQSEVDERYLDERHSFEAELRAYKAYEADHTKKSQKQSSRIKELKTEEDSLLQKRTRLEQKKSRVQRDIDQADRLIEEIGNRMMRSLSQQRKERTDCRQQQQDLLKAEIDLYESRLKTDFEQ